MPGAANEDFARGARGDGAEPLDEIDARAIEHAATIFALEMLHERTAYELEARLKGDLATCA